MTSRRPGFPVSRRDFLMRVAQLGGAGTALSALDALGAGALAAWEGEEWGALGALVAGCPRVNGSALGSSASA